MNLFTFIDILRYMSSIAELWVESTELVCILGVWNLLDIRLRRPVSTRAICFNDHGRDYPIEGKAYVRDVGCDVGPGLLLTAPLAEPIWMLGNVRTTGSTWIKAVHGTLLLPQYQG